MPKDNPQAYEEMYNTVPYLNTQSGSKYQKAPTEVTSYKGTVNITPKHNPGKESY